MNDYDAILVALRRITRAIDLHSKTLAKLTGLTTSQLVVMNAIRKIGEPSPSAIAKEVVLSQATVTSILDRLIAKNLVSKEKSQTDRRVVHVHLTDEGVAKLIDAPELLQSEFLRTYRELPSWQQHMLVAALQQIAAMMNAEDIDASPVLDVGELTPH
ncbi:MAG: MarR family transcriptional regulator [Gammaproteobacteria bacterium]|nr:MarR family transcriptional regulator [Gammaproteobacteria bacterium]